MITINRGRNTTHTSLRARWEQWSEIVHLFAFRSDKRHSLDEEAYQVLHADLCQLCRPGEDGNGNRASDREAGSETSPLWKLVVPWSTLCSLERADRALVEQLDDHCREVQRFLGGSRAAGLRWQGRRNLIISLGMLLLAAVVAAMSKQGSNASSAVAREIHRWLAGGQQFVSSSGLALSFLTVTGAVTLIAIAIVWRSTSRG